MRLAALFLTLVSFASGALACGSATPSASVPTAPGAPASESGAPATSSPSAAALAAPGPAAMTCTDDSACGAHRCNVAAGKCAFPCATDADCVAGASCVAGAVSACLAKKP